MSPIRSYKSLDSATKRIVNIGAIALIALTLCGGLGSAILFNVRGTANHADNTASHAELSAAKAEAKAEAASAAAQATCPILHDLAELPLPVDPQAFSLTLTVKSRVAYSTQGCVSVTGELKPADPKIAKLLPPGVK